MSHTICAITVDTKPKRYIQSTFNRFDKTVGVETTTDVNLAKDYRTMASAKELVPKIFNPYDRKYHAEKVAVNMQVRTAAMEGELK